MAKRWKVLKRAATFLNPFLNFAPLDENSLGGVKVKIIIKRAFFVGKKRWRLRRALSLHSDARGWQRGLLIGCLFRVPSCRFQRNIFISGVACVADRTFDGAAGRKNQKRYS